MSNKHTISVVLGLTFGMTVAIYFCIVAKDFHNGLLFGMASGSVVAFLVSNDFVADFFVFLKNSIEEDIESPHERGLGKMFAIGCFKAILSVIISPLIMIALLLKGKEPRKALYAIIFATCLTALLCYLHYSVAMSINELAISFKSRYVLRAIVAISALINCVWPSILLALLSLFLFVVVPIGISYQVVSEPKYLKHLGEVNGCQSGFDKPFTAFYFNWIEMMECDGRSPLASLFYMIKIRVGNVGKLIWWILCCCKWLLIRLVKYKALLTALLVSGLIAIWLGIIKYLSMPIHNLKIMGLFYAVLFICGVWLGTKVHWYVPRYKLPKLIFNEHKCIYN